MKIWKYELPAMKVTLSMPEGAVVRHVAPQGSTVCLWAEVPEKTAVTVTRKFETYGTGHDIPEGSRWVATWQQGVFVWHLYEVVS